MKLAVGIPAVLMTLLLSSAPTAPVFDAEPVGLSEDVQNLLAKPLPATYFSEPCPGTCHPCPTWGGHNAQENPVGGAEEGENGWHSCGGGNNCDGHQCDNEEEQQDSEAGAELAYQFGQALLSQDSGLLAGILASAPERVQYVPERNAVQLLGCTGEVVTSIPLAPVPARRVSTAPAP